MSHATLDTWIKNKGNDETGAGTSTCSASKKPKHSYETPFVNLRCLPVMLKLPKIQTDDPSHTVLAESYREMQTALPSKYIDRWDDLHVRMPCSPENSIPVDVEKDIHGKFVKQWDVIERVLRMPIKSSKDLENAIKSYNNSKNRSTWDFNGLHYFFAKVLSDAERQSFFSDILPHMIELVLDLPKICPHPIPLLKRQTTHKVTLSQKQVACLLANAFLCTFPGRDIGHKADEYKTFPEVNFNRMYAKSDRGMSHKVAQKMKCILHYFKRITSKEPDGCITFHRQCLKEFPKWDREQTKLGNFHITSEGRIEVEGAGMLQLDFADKFIGGLLFTHGLVQEEIRFVICPELILCRLFTEVIDANECVIITGCEQFSTYKGYAHTFEWTGDFIDKTTRDEWNRHHTQVLAIDATRFHDFNQQFTPPQLKREIEKAYCGFWAENECYLSAVATGNWGCGVFKGDPHLKSLLQWMAASVAGRDMCYFTFHDTDLCKDIRNMLNFLTEKVLTVGKLWNLLLEYHALPSKGASKPGLYEFIYGKFDTKMPIFYIAKPKKSFKKFTKK